MSYKTAPATAGSRPGGPRTRKKPVPRTPLAKWLADFEGSTDEAAKAFGVSVYYLYKLRDGSRAPGRDIAIKIEEVTDGAVRADSWPETTRAKRNKS